MWSVSIAVIVMVKVEGLGFVSTAEEGGLGVVLSFAAGVARCGDVFGNPWDAGRCYFLLG